MRSDPGSRKRIADRGMTAPSRSPLRQSSIAAPVTRVSERLVSMRRAHVQQKASIRDGAADADVAAGRCCGLGWRRRRCGLLCGAALRHDGLAPPSRAVLFHYQHFGGQS
jgi:hypothetical protein